MLRIRVARESFLPALAADASTNATGNELESLTCPFFWCLAPQPAVHDTMHCY